MKKKAYDVIIIGGSYAGLSAAMALARLGRNVLVIDNGNPCNKQAPQSHNFITWDGVEPSAIVAKATEQLLSYPTVTFINGTATETIKKEHHFEARLEKGETFSAKKLLFSSGISDIMPDIKDFPVCWGISVLHCPYCHGYEERGKRTAVLANGHQAYITCMVLYNLTKEIILLTNGKSTLSKELTGKLKSHQIEIIEKKVERILHHQGKIESIVFEDKSQMNAPVMYAKIPFKQQCDLPEKMGCEMTEEGLIKVDENKKTSVYGVYAAGDNTTHGRTISIAVASGTIAAMMMNGELSLEEF
jgi:thioredoxin reductase